MKKFFVMAAMSALLFTSCDNDKKGDKEDDDNMVTNGNESQEEKNKQTALACVNALISGDVDATVKDGTADVTDFGDGSMPPVKGMDSLKAALHNWRDAMSEYKADNLWAIADGDQVAVFGDWSITFKSDLMGMKTAGKSVKMKDVDIFKFNSEGKITEHRNIQSSAEMIRQLSADSPK
jgi:predicted ester cyclase